MNKDEIRQAELPLVVGIDSGSPSVYLVSKLF